MTLNTPPYARYTVLVFSLCAGLAHAGPAVTDEQGIRQARAAFNAAIEQQDAEAIAEFLSPEYHIVTSRNQQTHGRADNAREWAEIFAEDPGFKCRRDAGDIEVNASWGQAQELGRWTCWFNVDGEAVEAAGVYAAKWLLAESGRWLVLSEVFTATRCSGSEPGCAAPNPPGAD